jgi:hypothetical protein
LPCLDGGWEVYRGGEEQPSVRAGDVDLHAARRRGVAKVCWTQKTALVEGGWRNG